MENIGARRLHTIMERVLDDLAFEAPELGQTTIPITAAYVRERLEGIPQGRGPLPVHPLETKKGGSFEPPFRLTVALRAARRAIIGKAGYFLLPREGAGAVRTGVGAGRPPPGAAMLGPRDEAPIELPPP